MARAFREAKAISSLHRVSTVMTDGPVMLVFMTGINAVCRIEQSVSGRWVKVAYREGSRDPFSFVRAERLLRRDLKRLAAFYEQQQANPSTCISPLDQQCAIRESDLAEV